MKSGILAWNVSRLPLIHRICTSEISDLFYRATSEEFKVEFQIKTQSNWVETLKLGILWWKGFYVGLGKFQNNDLKKLFKQKQKQIWTNRESRVCVWNGSLHKMRF